LAGLVNTKLFFVNLSVYVSKVSPRKQPKEKPSTSHWKKKFFRLAWTSVRMHHFMFCAWCDISA